MWITYEFEEIPLVIGKDRETGKPQRIALITGKCSVSANRTFDSITGQRGWEWEVEDITIEGPILYDQDVKIPSSHPLYQFVVDSIEERCGDKIWDELTEAA